MFKDGRVQYVEPFSEYQDLAQVVFLKEPPMYDLWEKTSYFLNKEGKIKFKLKYEHGNIEQLSKYRDDIFVFENIKDDERIVQLIQNINGENKILHKFDWIEYGEEEGTFAVKKDGKYGFIDINGNLFIDCKYDDYMSFDRQIARVQLNNKWYAINKKEEMIEIEFDIKKEENQEDDELYFNSNNNIIVKGPNGKYGLMNKSKEIVVDFIYEQIIEENDYFKARKNDKWGYIENSPEPKELFDFCFDSKWDLGNFYDGYAIVKMNKLNEIMNTQGKREIYSSLCDMHNLGNGLILVGEKAHKLVDVKKLNS